MTTAKAKRGRTRAPGQVTLRDVALAAGVSPMSVSNFINARHNTMGADTRDRIEAAIARLGYRPHAAARNLRLSRRLSIGMLIVDEAPLYLADPFTTHIVAGLSNRLSADGYGLQLQGISADGFSVSPLIRDIRTDALCVLSSGSNAARRSIATSLLELGQPVLLFQETFRIAGADLCVIRQDDREGGRLVAAEVLRRPLKSVAVLVPATTWPAIGERLAGMREVIAAAPGKPDLRVVVCGNADMTDTKAALAADIDDHGFPDAVLAGNDQMGIAAMKLIVSRGKRVPHDVAITGFNAFDFWEYTDPVLTTVRSPAYEMGSRGGEEILKRLTDGAFARREIVFPVSLQRGTST